MCASSRSLLRSRLLLGPVWSFIIHWSRSIAINQYIYERPDQRKSVNITRFCSNSVPLHLNAHPLPDRWKKWFTITSSLGILKKGNCVPFQRFHKPIWIVFAHSERRRQVSQYDADCIAVTSICDVWKNHYLRSKWNWLWRLSQFDYRLRRSWRMYHILQRQTRPQFDCRWATHTRLLRCNDQLCGSKSLYSALHWKCCVGKRLATRIRGWWKDLEAKDLKFVAKTCLS